MNNITSMTSCDSSISLFLVFDLFLTIIYHDMLAEKGNTTEFISFLLQHLKSRMYINIHVLIHRDLDTISTESSDSKRLFSANKSIICDMLMLYGRSCFVNINRRILQCQRFETVRGIRMEECEQKSVVFF